MFWIALQKGYDFIDAILLDFTTEDIKHFLNDKNSSYYNVIYKSENGIIEREERHSSGEFFVPLPRHELFKNDKYSFPFSKQKLFSTVLTNFGCPYKCTFCVVNRFNFKERSVSAVIEELKFVNKINIKEVVFKDQTFAANSKKAELLCQEMVNEGIKISWTCFSRIDLMNEPLLLKMKSAGCHTIIFGIETANSRLLSTFNKLLDINKIKEVVRLCKSLNIKTVGTFIIGLPGDDRLSIEMTITSAKECCFDYASFNIFTPAYGTEIRNRLLKESAIDNNVSFMDRGISYPTHIKGCLSQKQIWLLRRAAILKFYFDPVYIFKKIKDCKTIFDAMNMLNQGLGVLRTLI
ncbi:MAG: radical SAM protein [Candidatus Omnitrophica bacterium]|nr:radical SAM protein [Candidatus Omnitrophota bacterium]